MEDENSWGDAKLYGFSGTETDEDGNVISGFSGTRDLVYGVDDYIEINSDADFSEDGLTIEMYGFLGDDYQYLSSIYKGPREGSESAFKFGCANTHCTADSLSDYFQVTGTFYQGIPTGTNYQCPVAMNDFHIPIYNNEVYEGEPYVTFSLKEDGSFYILLNGEKVVEDKFNEDYVEHYKEYLSNKDYPIIIGKNAWGDIFYYGNARIYATRIYNRTLTEEEAIDNYEKTVASRALFESE